MASTAFDTLKLSRQLKAAGFTPEQADGLAKALNDSLGEAAVTQDYLDVRLAELRADLLKWMVGALAAQAAIIVALIRLL